MRVPALFLPMFCAAALLIGAPMARAAVQIDVAGNTATTAIELNGVEAEFILTFDDADALSAGNLGISAQLVSITDPLLLSRLPTSSLTSIPAALPLMITVEPGNGTGFALRNTVRAEVHTHALPYTAGSHFRLFKAPLGGSFVDITDEVAPGSVRTRGTTGGFSQFLVLVDLRSTDAVIASKFASLRSRAGAAPADLRSSLTDRLDAAQASVAAGSFAAAAAALDDFRALVSANAGTALSNQWTPSVRDSNVAGDLLSGAASLKFSVAYLRDYGN